MTIHHYGVLGDDGQTIVNVNVIDDEAVGWDHGKQGKWEPWGIKEAEAAGWIYLGPKDEPLTDAWIGWTAKMRWPTTPQGKPARWIFTPPTETVG